MYLDWLHDACDSAARSAILVTMRSAVAAAGASWRDQSSAGDMGHPRGGAGGDVGRIRHCAD